MKLQEECKNCLKEQIKRFLNKNKLDSINKNNILNKVNSSVNNFKSNYYLTPPEAAIEIYSILKTSLNTKDPYNNIKNESKKLAKEITKDIKVNSLEEALKMCVVGNAIDYGSQSDDKILDALQNTFKEKWGINHINNFKHMLNNAKNILFIADNAGENYFDEILLKFLKNNYYVNITYLTRGEAIINDLTLDDLNDHKSLSNICNIKSSGVNSPGFIYERSNIEAQNYFDDACLIISKGMGNFECLEAKNDPRIFFLLKIKCDVVSKFVNIPKGRVVLLQKITNKITL